MSRFLHKFLGIAGIAAFSAVSLPAMAQTSPRTSGSAADQAQPATNQPLPGTSPSSREMRPGRPGDVPAPANPSNRDMTPGNSQMSPMNRTTIPGQGQQSSASITSLDRQFITMAAQGNNAEIQLSQLALQRGSSASVKQYAQQMINQHTAANQQLQQIAQRYGMRLPSDAGPLNTAVAQKLSQLSGQEFDRAYIGAQVNAHMMSKAVFQTESQQGGNQALISYANQLLPAIDQHLTLASRMNGQPSALR